MRALFWSIAIILFFMGFGKCEFYVIQAPSTMQFAASEEKVIPRNELMGVINFLFGLPSKYLQKTQSWPGLQSFDVFNPPKTNVLITFYLPAGNAFTPEEFKIKYPISETEGLVSPVDELNRALSEEGIESQSYALRDRFSGLYGEVDFGKVDKRLAEDNSVLSLLPTGIGELGKDDETKRLLGELQMLSDIADELVVKEEQQSLHILLTALHRLAEKYGSTSAQVKTAIQLYKHFIHKFDSKLEKKFQNDILVEVDAISEVVPSPHYLVRHKRSPTSTSTDATTAEAQSEINITTANLATPSTENYAVIFSIVLWLMIAFSLAVLAASYSMWFMDPGKDNIIYRAATQRMKSD